MNVTQKLSFLLIAGLLAGMLLTACVVSAPAPAQPAAPEVEQPAAPAEPEAQQPATEAEAELPAAEEAGAVPEAAGMVEPLSPPEKVVVAYVPITKFATLYVAAHHGIFEKYGLEVDIQEVKSGTEAIAFLTEG